MEAAITQYYLSRLLSSKVRMDDRSVGKTVDLAIDLDNQAPEVHSFVYRERGGRIKYLVNWADVLDIINNDIILRSDASSSPFQRPETSDSHHIFLKQFLLDKQIVDVYGAKVERVNDLVFVKSDGRLRLIQVDVGLRGLLRRLGWETAFVNFCEWFFDYTPKEKFINWKHVEPLADPDRLRLQIPGSRLSELHPADLADILEDLDVHERAAVVESLDSEVIADALEEMYPKVQVAIMRGLEPDRAADIIEEMSPDEAADLIADLPSDAREDILEELEDEYEQQVKGLMAHEEDTAGGYMTTEFLSLAPNKTIVDALAHIRKHADEVDIIYYTYIVDSESNLLGVVTLRELLSNEIFTPLERIMTTRLISVKVDADADVLVDLFGKYGFRAVPVVDDDGRLTGVVRYKTILDILAPHFGR